MKEEIRLIGYKDINEYKRKTVEEITGCPAEILEEGKVPVWGTGVDALYKAQKILQTRYTSMETLKKDLEELKYWIEDWSLFD